MDNPNNTSVPDANGIVWRQLKSKDGKDFEIGWKHLDSQKPNAPGQPLINEHDVVNADDIHHDNIVPVAAMMASDKNLKVTVANPEDHGWIPVNWPVGDDKWIDTDQSVKDEGISRYCLYFNGHPNVDSYTLEFTNTKGWSFHFIDDTKDVYSIDTVWNSDHWLKYNSEQPTIKFVKEGSYGKSHLTSDVNSGSDVQQTNFQVFFGSGARIKS